LRCESRAKVEVQEGQWKGRCGLFRRVSCGKKENEEGKNTDLARVGALVFLETDGPGVALSTTGEEAHVALLQRKYKG
jgi:hypothetical protein